jgi:hypothetical protein
VTAGRHGPQDQGRGGHDPDEVGVRPHAGGRIRAVVGPSSEAASLVGSLPTNTAVPTVPLTGSIGVMLLPPGPALPGTLA